MHKNRLVFLLIIIMAAAMTIITACSTDKISSTENTPSVSATSTKTPRPTKTSTGTPGPTAVLPVELSAIEIHGLPHVTFSLDNKTAYLNYSDHFEIVDALTFEPISDPNLENMGIIGVYGFSPDGKIVIVQTLQTSPQIGLLNLETKNIQQLGSWANNSIDVNFSKNSNYAIYSMGLQGFNYNCGYIEGISYSDELTGGKFPLSTDGCYDDQKVSFAAVSSDGTLAAGAVSQHDSSSLYIWDVHDQSILHEIPNLPAHILSVDFSPDGSTLVSLSEDGNINFWNPLTGQKIRNIPGVINHASSIRYTENSSILQIKYRHDLYTYNLASGKLTKLPPEGLSDVEIHLIEQGQIRDGYSNDILFSPDGNLIATISGSIQVRDAVTYELLHIFYEDEFFQYANAVFSKDSTKLAIIVKSGNVFIWDLETGNQLLSLDNANRNDFTPHNEVLFSDGPPYISDADYLGLAFSPDGENIAITNASYVEVWNIANKKKIMTLEQISSELLPTKISYSEDGRNIYGVLNLNQDIAVWNTNDGKLIKRLDLPDENPGYYLDTILFEELFTREYIDGESCTIEIRNLETNEILDTKTFSSRNNYYLFTQDKTYIAGFFRSEFNLWNFKTGEITVIPVDRSDERWTIRRDNNLLAFYKADILGFLGATTLMDYEIFYTDISAFAENIDNTTKITATPLPDVYDANGFYIGNDEYFEQDDDYLFDITVIPNEVPELPSSALSRNNIDAIVNSAAIGHGEILKTKWGSNRSHIHVISSTGYYLLDAETLSIIETKQIENLTIVGGEIISDTKINLCGITPDGTTQIWDIKSSQMILEIDNTAPTDISPNGKWVANLLGDPNSYYTYMSLVTWNVNTKKQEYTMSTNPHSKDFLFSADSNYMALITDNTEIQLWDVNTGLLKQTIHFETPISSFNFSGNSKYILIGVQSKVYLWHIYTQQFTNEIDFSNIQEEYTTPYNQDVVTSIAMNNKNTQMMVALEGKIIWIYDMITDEKIGTISGTDSIIKSMSFSPDDSILQTVDENGRLSHWETHFWKKVAISNDFIGEVQGLTALTNGSVAAWSSNQAILFTPENGEITNQIIIPESKILDISPDGSYIAGNTPHRISMYDLQTGSFLLRLPIEAEFYFSTSVWGDHLTTQFYGGDFSSDAKHFIAYGSGGIWMLDPASGALVSYPEFGGITAKAAISSDGEFIVYSYGEYIHGPMIVDFYTGEFIQHVQAAPVDAYDAEIYKQYEFSPDKNWLALLRYYGSQPALLDIVSTSTGRLTKQTTLGNEEPMVMTFNPDGSLVAVGFKNGEIKIVDFESDEIILAFQAHISSITAIVFTQDGEQIITADETGQIKVWGLE